MNTPNPTALNIDSIQPYTPRPRFDVNNSGVYWIGTRTGKDGETLENEPMRLSDPIDIIGSGQDSSGAYFRIIRWTDKLTRRQRTAAIPCAQIGSISGWQQLQSYGITVLNGRVKRERLADYLLEQGGREQWLITDKAGWINGAYILPNGEIITPAEPLEPTSQTKPMRVLYNGDKSQAQAYQVSGSLKEWQDNIARYAQHNSRLCLALGTAFAAPLLSLLNLEGGGFHIYGESASGKSTALYTGLSVWASPKAKNPWNATAYALSNAAAARNDNTLMLDEIGENHDMRAIAKTVYSLANGQGKIQGHKDGGNRETIEFKVLFFSTGEHPLESYVTQKDRAQWNAGQNVRLPSIPSNTGKNIGAFDTLHGFAAARELADHLNQAAYRYHGIAGREFIQQLNSGSLKAIRDLIAQFMAQLPPLGSQAMRVARRFAIAAAALEYAQTITGFQAGQGMNAIKQCFDTWLQHNGSGDFEQERIIAQTRDFFDKYAYGLRFAHRNALREDHAPNHCGYYEEKNGIRILHVIPAFMESEAWQGFDKSKACEVLIAIDWLEKGKDRYTMQLDTAQGKKWLYRFHGATPPESIPSATPATETTPY